MSDSDGCCRCCCSFIITCGLSAFFLWLSLRASLPACYIQQFYVPALNKTSDSSSSSSVSGNLTATNTTLFIQIKLDNKNKEKGIYYDSLNLTIFYGSNRTIPVANATSPAFYRGGNKKYQWTQLVATYGVPWDDAIKGSASNGSGVVFRVGLQTAVRFKIALFKTKRHKLVVGADVALNDMGTKVKNKDVKLSSTPPPLLKQRADLVLWTLFAIPILCY